MKSHQSLIIGAVVAGMLLATGCASHPRQVSCEGHLVPINAPAPKAAPVVQVEPSEPAATSWSLR